MLRFLERHTGKPAVSACATLIGLCALAFVSMPAYADYDYELVIYPGAVDTAVFGINDRGMAVGTASLTGAAGSYFSFVYDSKKGTYTEIPELDSALAINNQGVIVGEVEDGSGFAACAIRDKDGTVTTFFPPSYGNLVDPVWDGCQARAVNSSGKVTGFVAGNAGTEWIGFVYDPRKGAFEEFLPSPNTIAQGINRQGEIVGSVTLDFDEAYPGSLPGRYGFLRDKTGNFKFFTVNGSLSTRARGISDSGEITGFIDGQTFTGGFEIDGFVIELSNSPGFENIDLTPEQQLAPFPCNLVEPLPPVDWNRFTDVFGQAINSKGVVAGLCWDYDILFDPPGDTDGAFAGFILYDGAGFIATPQCSGKKCK